MKGDVGMSSHEKKGKMKGLGTRLVPSLHRVSTDALISTMSHLSCCKTEHIIISVWIITVLVESDKCQTNHNAGQPLRKIDWTKYFFYQNAKT